MPNNNASAFNVSSSDQPSINASRSSYNNNPKQKKVQCSHCGYLGHSVDGCYKIHGYPPGFKHKYKTATDKPSTSEKASASPKPVVANLSMEKASSASTSKSGIESKDIATLIGGLSKNQIQDVIAYFSTQLQIPSTMNHSVESLSPDEVVDSVLNGISFSFSTLCFIGVLTSTKTSLTAQTWIIDGGATHHVSHDK